MLRVILAFFLAFGPAMIGHAATGPGKYDGAWKVLIVTKSGGCDDAYRYDIKVANGRVSYDGGGSFEFSGSVEVNGAVKVKVSRGQQHASGSGRLAAQSGRGTWRGRGATGDCAGYWEAERR